MCLPSSVCRKCPARPRGLETFTNAQNHRKHPEENIPSLSDSPAPPPSPPQLLTGNGFGTRKLEKGQRWVREKHRWFSDGLALSDPDSPTQSQHLRGQFHEASNISLFQQFQPPARKMVHGRFYLSLNQYTVWDIKFALLLLLKEEAGLVLQVGLWMLDHMQYVILLWKTLSVISGV